MKGCAVHSTLPPLALLAGGLATRMYPRTAKVPKSLLLIDGEPFLAHQLRLLASQGFHEIVLCCGHLGEQIEAFAGDGSQFGCSIRYSYDGAAPKGTGGALRDALPLLDDSFFVMYGDSYLLLDPVQVWRSFLASRQPALMTVWRNEGQLDASNVEWCDGKIVRYDKQSRDQKLRYVDYGLSMFRAEVLAVWPESAPFDLADVMTQLASDGKLAGYEVPGRFYEIGSPEGFRATELLLTESRPAPVGVSR